MDESDSACIYFDFAPWVPCISYLVLQRRIMTITSYHKRIIALWVFTLGLCASAVLVAWMVLTEPELEVPLKDGAGDRLELVGFDGVVWRWKGAQKCGWVLLDAEHAFMQVADGGEIVAPKKKQHYVVFAVGCGGQRFLALKPWGEGQLYGVAPDLSSIDLHCTYKYNRDAIRKFLTPLGFSFKEWAK
jgi:hypothetical protein